MPKYVLDLEEALSGDFKIKMCPSCGGKNIGIAFGHPTCEDCNRIMVQGVWIAWERFLLQEA
ncbi:MAG TPA: hypothetical protein VIH03_02350 [Nitrososphaerales archaeon]